MFLIVGLGNPGIQYEHTRHNVGFDAIDFIGEKYNIPISRVKFKGVYGEGVIKGEKAILLKPSTYMNLSGESVQEVSRFYKIPNDRILVVYDDISLELGRLRIRDKGSAGGHNGIKSIILHLSTEVFPRVKIGVGQPQGDLVDHVLGKFCGDERAKVEQVLKAAAAAVEVIIERGTTEAMNQYNSFKA
jgi:peptidyl-tRNA hydrolase, PTH1 family